MFRAWIAASPPSLISTNANPRLRPVSRSVTTWALVTVPNCPHRASRSSEVVPKARFPTYNFVLTTHLPRPCPGRITRRTPGGKGPAGRTCERGGATRPRGRQHRSIDLGGGAEGENPERRHQDGSEGSCVRSTSRVGSLADPCGYST